MNKALSVFISAALCLGLAACGGKPVANINDGGASPPPSTPAAATGTPEASAKPDSAPGDMYRAYADALEELMGSHVFPDGTDGGFAPGYEMSENEFAVYDVDNDGKEELILLYFSTYTAGMAGYVFAYDSEAGTLRAQLQEFPLLTFYDNGIIKAGWSHNQGRAGDSFWPYGLYQYAPETDSYIRVGMVDAWDKGYAGTDERNEPFPSEIDQSGTGVVYYIMTDGEYDNTHPVDASAYNEWVDSYIGGALERQPEYRSLTEENVSRLRNG